MILSETIKVKYKLDTCGLQTHEVAKLLRDKGVNGLLAIAFVCIFTYIGDSQEREQNKRSDTK